MQFIRMTMVVAFIVAALPGFAKDKEAQFKSVEAKHFERAEGVELSPEFTDYLYAELRAELTKAKLFGQVLGEGEVVDAADQAEQLRLGQFRAQQGEAVRPGPRGRRSRGCRGR